MEKARHRVSLQDVSSILCIIKIIYRVLFIGDYASVPNDLRFICNSQYSRLRQVHPDYSQQLTQD